MSTLFLFDIDGTLTLPRQVITRDMYDFVMKEVGGKFHVGLVGGSDVIKIREQMGPDFELSTVSYVFPENGLVAYEKGVKIGEQSLVAHLGEEKMQRFINYALSYMSTLQLPRKRGNFVELRTGLVNLCPVGRSCTQAEREEFYEFDKKAKIREDFVANLRRDLSELNLQYSIGGQISIDAFPKGWDKSYCLRFLENFREIHFFGDKTEPGGNDYEIFTHPKVIGHVVISPEDTKEQLKAILGRKSKNGS